jgi:sterol 24-C-methyltransferase
MRSAKDKNEDAGKTVERVKNAQTLAETYYNLATDFYEYGWGQSFHFAARFPGEGFQASLQRHEYYLASKLGLKPGQHALDVGCGVGGPQRYVYHCSTAHLRTRTGTARHGYYRERWTEASA